MEEDITLEVFLELMREKLDEFEAYWDKKHGEDADAYPKENWMGDWFENFGAWIETALGK